MTGGAWDGSKKRQRPQVKPFTEPNGRSPGAQGNLMNSNSMKTVKEYAWLLIVSAVLLLLVRAFVVQAFKIPTGSMLGTLHVGDQLLVSKFQYGIKNPFTGQVLIPVADPHRGDIIVFEYPYDVKLDAVRPNMKDTDFVKRVVGLPGDVVEIRAKQVFVNGQRDNGPYIIHTQGGVVTNPLPESIGASASPQNYFDHCDESSTSCSSKRDWMPQFTVPAGMFFVMGDNRDESYDSRFWGFVPNKNIKGKAMIIYWSWTGPSNIRWDRLGKVPH